MTSDALPSHAAAAYPLGGRRSYAVWLTAVAVYFLAIFHRSSLGVAGLVAAERFHISASQLSTFTVLQLLVYAAMQIPVGVLLDRFGPQRLIFAGAVLMTAAQLGFAFTGTYAGALVARIFVGMGDAMVFISVLRIIASWFPPMRNPMITAFTAMIGQSGALVAAIPLSSGCSHCWWSVTCRRAHRRPGRSRTCGPSVVTCGWPGRTRAPGWACGRTSPVSSRPT
jgi:MFS family permease